MILVGGEFMANDNINKSIRLLDIVYDLHGDDKRYPYQHLPFSVSESGAVVLSDNLLTALNKDENVDLVDWAHENIVGLFE